MIALLLGVALAGVVEDTGQLAALEDADTPRRVAILVGIDAFEDPALTDLRFAGKDATDLARVLSDPEHGAFDEVHLLTDAPTRADLLQQLEDVSRTLFRDDLLLVYFAGHGTLDLASGGTKLYLLAADGELARPRQTGVAIDDLEQRLQATAPRRRVLIIDACHSGTGRSGLPPNVRVRLDHMRGDAPLPELMAIGRYDARLFAARLHDPALEDDNLENGVYTHFLIDALSGDGDLDGDGVVDVIEAHAWTRDRTLRYTDGLQVPWLRVSEEGRTPVLLAGTDTDRSDATHAILSELEALPRAARIRLDGVDRGAGTVEPGRHHLRVELEDNVLVDKNVSFRPGDRVDVHRLVRYRAAGALFTGGGTWTLSSAATDALLPVVGGRAGGFWIPADAGGGRLVVGGIGSASFGEVADIGFTPGGLVAASGAWMWGDAWSMGARADAGLLWRLTVSGPQATPAVAPRLWGIRSKGSVLVEGSVGAITPLRPVDDAWRALPSVELGVGWRL